MIKLENLKGKTKEEIVKICRDNGYSYVKRNPEFFAVGREKPVKENPLLLAGIRTTDYIRFTELTKDDEEILIVDIFNGFHSPVSDENIISSKLFSSENRTKGFKVGYAWDLK